MGPPVVRCYKLVYKPHEYHSYLVREISTINHSYFSHFSKPTFTRSLDWGPPVGESYRTKNPKKHRGSHDLYTHVIAMNSPMKMGESDFSHIKLVHDVP